MTTRPASQPPFSFIVFLIDQSAATLASLGGTHEAINEVVAAAVNRCLKVLGESSFEFAVVGYSGNSTCEPVVESWRNGELDELEIRAEGKPAINEAFEKAYEIASGWIDEHWESRPPLVVHIAAESTGPLLDARAASGLIGLDSAKGSLTLIHCLLSESPGDAEILFPMKPADLPEGELRGLFRKSSRLSEELIAYLAARLIRVNPGAHGLVLMGKSETLETLLMALLPQGGGGISTGTSDEAVELDKNVQFTVYSPQVIRPDEKWCELLAFAHLDKLRPDADEDEEDPLEEVVAQAKKELKKNFESYRASSEPSRAAVPREGELTFALRMEGLDTKPAQQTIVWGNSVEKVKFWIRASADLEGETCFGELNVYYGVLLIGSLGLRILVSSTETARPHQAAQARIYRKIFVSYSHHDDPKIINTVQKCIKALGDEFLIDAQNLRAGENWNDALMKMIRDADVFQLYWSSNASRSQFVTQEWQYALSLREKKIKPSEFVRGLYWEQPLPSQPPELQPLQFYFLGGDNGSGHGITRDQGIALEDFEGDDLSHADSGINLTAADSGVDLDSCAGPIKEDDSEIELTLDEKSGDANLLGSDSEFELSMETVEFDDNSEFELSTDAKDSGDTIMFDEEEDSEFESSMDSDASETIQFDDDNEDATIVKRSKGISDDFVRNGDSDLLYGDLDDLDVFDRGADDFNAGGTDAGFSPPKAKMRYSAPASVPPPPRAETLEASVTFGKILLFLLCIVVFLGGLVALVLFTGKKPEDANDSQKTAPAEKSISWVDREPIIPRDS